MPAANKKNHWNDHARQWSRIGSPLRPCHEDVEIIRRSLAQGDDHYLLLGVTQELTRLTDHMVAVDHNVAMIAALWRGNSPGCNIVHGDWMHLPFAAYTFAAVVGDGCLCPLAYPLQYEQLLAQLQLVLKPGGKALLRLFSAPDESETCVAVCDAALAGKIAGFHAFKWRLAMALVAENGDPNVAVDQIYATFARLLPDRQRLAAASGWSMEDIATIDVYRGSGAVYSFPTLAQLRQVIPQGLREAGMVQGSYELAERCPTLILESSQ